MEDVVIIGAGVAGLSLARALEERGKRPVVLDKSRGVGGRAATRRVEGQPVDHGVAFLHGSHPDFLAALDAVEATPIRDWPRSVHGEGRPCQPQAFHRSHRRMAFAEGITAFPKSLAAGLDVRHRRRVIALSVRGDRIEVRLEKEDPVVARKVVLALPLEQARELLEPLSPENEELRAAANVLRMLATEPCLALLAGYDRTVPEPSWDFLYPSEGEALMLASHDSAKRVAGAKRHAVLVYQCTSRFSRRHLEEDPSLWVPLVLGEAAELVGPWAGRPLWREPHRWRYSRVSAVNTLAQPFWVPLRGGAGVGLAGEAFSPGGGVEGAYLSGRRLAPSVLGDG